jgi:hypothetical protein
MHSGAKDKILTLLLFGVLGSVGAAFYVWQDRPGLSDAGLPTLSGWLVDTFGPRAAEPVGIFLFSVLALLLFVAVFWLVRLWQRNPAP